MEYCIPHDVIHASPSSLATELVENVGRYEDSCDEAHTRKKTRDEKLLGILLFICRMYALVIYFVYVFGLTCIAIIR